MPKNMLPFLVEINKKKLLTIPKRHSILLSTRSKPIIRKISILQNIIDFIIPRNMLAYFVL